MEDAGRSDGWAGPYRQTPGLGVLGRMHSAALNAAAAMRDHAPPKVVLDVGCGTGRLLRRAGRRWPDASLTGIDPDEESIEEARRGSTGASFAVGSAESLPLPESSVDLAVSTLSFHHWEDHGKGLREIRRVLRRGGSFCLADINLPRPLAFVFRHFPFPRGAVPGQRPVAYKVGADIAEFRQRANHHKYREL